MREISCAGSGTSHVPRTSHMTVRADGFAVSQTGSYVILQSQYRTEKSRTQMCAKGTELLVKNRTCSSPTALLALPALPHAVMALL